jgi:putative lipoic acid-binding regulatory protein
MPRTNTPDGDGAVVRSDASARMDPIEGQPQIDYPCPWSYQLIGPDEELLRRAVRDVIGDLPHTLSSGKTSSGGKYISLGLEIVVTDARHRLQVFDQLAKHPAVRFVI